MKGTGLLKLFVLSLFTLGISYFGLLKNSYVNATFTLVGLDSSPSSVNSNYDITFLKGGGLLTNFIGQSKGILALDSSVLFWWLPDGYPYFYGVGRASVQGYFPNYYICSPLTSGGNYQVPENCMSQSIDEYSVPIFNNFFSSVKAGDVVWYALENDGGAGWWWYGFQVCYDSSSMGKSLCFHTRYNYSNNAGLAGMQLVNSRGYTNLTFANLPYSEIGYAPGQAGYMGGGNIDGGSQVVDPNTTTGDVMTTTCSKSTALQWYRANGYKSRMCYSSYGNVSDLYTGPGDAQAYDLTGVSIEDVWFDSAWYRRNGTTGTSMSYSEWFSYWRKTYEAYKKNTNHTSPFLGVPVAIFTLMGNVDSYGLPYTDASILEFCDLALYTADYSASYSGIAQNTVCSLSAIDIAEITLMNSQNPDDGLPGYGNSSFNNSNGTIGSSRQGITNRPGMNNVPGYDGTGTLEMSGVNAFTDGTTFQNNFFNLVKSKFRYVDSAGHDSPIIPTYIVVFLCGLIIFRFMSH